MLRGETVTKIVEHPWLEGPQIIVVHPEALAPLPVMPWEPEHPSPDFDMRRYWYERLTVFTNEAADR